MVWTILYNYLFLLKILFTSALVHKRVYSMGHRCRLSTITYSPNLLGILSSNLVGTRLGYRFLPSLFTRWCYGHFLVFNLFPFILFMKIHGWLEMARFSSNLVGIDMHALNGSLSILIIRWHYFIPRVLKIFPFIFFPWEIEFSIFSISSLKPENCIQIFNKILIIWKIYFSNTYKNWTAIYDH